MPAYAAGAVRESLQPVAMMQRLSAPWTRRPTRAALAALAGARRILPF